jgi:hypothetical protein
MAAPDLNEQFARELQEQLDDPDLAGEFFATKEFPTDDIRALREWVSEHIDEQCFAVSKSVGKFLRLHLKTAEVVRYLRLWNS